MAANKMPWQLRWLLYILVVVALVVVGVYALNPYGTATLDPRARILGVTTFRIAGRSMAPTLQLDELVLVRASAYRSNPPSSGDLIVFRYPSNRSLSYVGRVVGRSGDKVSIDQGRVYVNGQALHESYLSPQSVVQPYSLNMAEVAVPQDHLFILGDNRDNSSDSRIWGFLPRTDVIGKIVYIWLSQDTERIGAVH